MIEVGSKWGAFHILGLLGRGGNCTVYRVRKENSSRDMALKVLHDPSNTLRFRREFRSMARLDHPNIAKVYEFGTHEDSSVFFTMEFIQGGDLKNVFKSFIAQRDTGIPKDIEEFHKLGQLFKDICQPLKYIHARKIIHRDLKPANIMLTKNSEIKLMDFGLIKTLDLIHETLTQSGTFVGTVNYMSPEQGLCRPLDTRSDLYSLGVIMYEAFSGRLPFYGETVMEMFMKHIRDIPPAPTHFNPHIPYGYSKLIMQLLEKQPGDRPGSAEEVETYLDQCMQEEEIHALRQNVITIESPMNITDETVVQKPGLYEAGIIGRKDELERVSQLLEYIESEPKHLVFVSGETGSGKTQFLHEVAIRARMKKYVVLRGACYEIESLPYSAVLPHLELLADKISQRSESELKRILGFQGPILATVCPRFGDIGYVRSQPIPQPLEPLQEKLRIFDALQSFFMQMAETSPYVLLIDNLHWADNLSFEFIHYFIRNLNRYQKTEKVPVMVIASYRSDDVPQKFEAFFRSVNRSVTPEEIPLLPFDIQKTRSMIAAILGIREPEQNLLELVFRESNGNPFFIEEIVKNLIDKKVLLQRRQRWFFDIEKLRDATPVVSNLSLSADFTLIPQKVQDLLSQRISEFREDIQDMLSRASVIGNRFRFDVLAAITNMSEDDILDLLDEALLDKIIVEIPESGGQEFRFKNRMVRNILYCSVHRHRRIRFHWKIAEALERLFGTDSPEKWDVLAYHYDKAKKYEKAIIYYLQAAENGLRTHAVHTAKEYTARSLDLLSKLENTHQKLLEKWVLALRIHGRSSGILGDFKGAFSDFNRLINIGNEQHDHQVESTGYYYLAGLKMDCGALDEALELYEKSLVLIPDTPDQAYSRMLRKNNIAQILIRKGHYQQALSIYRNLEEKMQSTGNESGLSLIRVNMGMLYYYMGRYDRAFEYVLANVERFRKLDHQFHLARALNNLSSIYAAKEDTQNALAASIESLEISENINDLLSIATINGNIAMLYMDQGMYIKAAEHCREAVELGRRLDLKTELAAALINLSIIQHIQGETSESMSLLKESLEITKKTGERWMSAHALLGYSECLVTNNEYEKAFESFKRTLDISETIGLKTIALRCKAYLLWMIKGLGLSKNSAFDEKTVLDDAIALGDVDCLIQVRWLLADMFYRNNRYNRSKYMAAAGLKLAKQINNAAFQWKFFVCIAQCLKKERRKPAALKCYRKALQIIIAMEQNVEERFRKKFLCQKSVQTAFVSAEKLALELGWKNLVRNWRRKINLCRELK